ncbi:MAG: PLP-dependent transferase [Chitinivibrionales bacterium]
MKKKTEILHLAAARDEQTGALSVPVFHASTYHQADVDAHQKWTYGRSANPTRTFHWPHRDIRKTRKSIGAAIIAAGIE